MQSYICILCKKCNSDYISICHKNGRNSTKEDILEICGNAVAQYLANDDLVCTNCMKILSNAAKLKRQVFEIILDHGVTRQLTEKTGSKELDAVEITHCAPQDSRCEEPTENVIDLRDASPRTISGASTSPQSSIGTSPDSLLVVKSSIPFDQRSDTDLEEANNKYRFYERDTPLLDEEVQRVNFRGRRRKKGNNWTRRKGSQKSRSHSLGSSHSRHSRSSRTNTHSRTSRGTGANRKQQNQQLSQALQTKRILSDFLYQNDTLGQFTRAYLHKNGEIIDDDLDSNYDWSTNAKPVVKTRYATDLRDKILAEYEQIVYECSSASCQEMMFSLEQITEHRVQVHNDMALFWCEQCKFSYLSQEHLDKHKDQHYKTFLSYCIYCSEEYTDKKLYEEHLNEHIIHSFPCIYCDKFFLNKQLCENHIREQHPGRKKKIKRIKPQSILDRIDKYPDSKNESPSWSTSKSPQEFVVRILWQHGHSEDSSTNNGEDLLDASCEDSSNENYVDMVNEDENDVNVHDLDK